MRLPPFALPVTLLLVAGALAGCDPALGDDDDRDGLTTPRTDVPDALVGSWWQGSLSTLDVYDPTTGHTAPANQSGFFYTFYEDGTYESGGIITSTLYDCTFTLWGYEVGTVTVEDDVLTTYSDGMHTLVEDNCAESGENYTDPETTEFRWGFETDDYGTTYLALTWPDGSKDYWQRWED